MKNPFKRFFHKDTVYDPAPFIGERIPLERLTPTDAEIAQMHAPKPPGYARFIKVMNQARGYYGESCFACGGNVPSGSGGEAPLGERLCLACFEISERVNFGRQFGYCIGDRVRTITGDEYNHRAGIVQSFDDEPGWIEVELDDMRGLASFLPTELQPENGDSRGGLPHF